MPELPEVETTRRGILPHLIGRTIASVVVREGRLRWPVSRELQRSLPGQSIHTITRRGKYLVLSAERGHLICHLGMSGSLRVLPSTAPAGRHDHIDLVLENASCLRLRDPRRFGALLWSPGPPLSHPLLAGLGPEPWEDGFSGAYLHARARGRRQSVKAYIMDSRTVVGLGNIYANEALFEAGIHPARRAGRIAPGRYERLAQAIRLVLERAIEAGGTTLRDFVASDGRPGYFARSLKVYGRAGQACTRCGALLRERRIGQRSAYYCLVCQR